MIKNNSTNMILPRAAVEMHSMSAGQTVYYARCKKCGGIIGDDTEPLEVSGLKPEDVKSTRIKCHHYVGRDKCGHINFVSHK